MIEQSVGAQRRDAADAAFLAAIVPLQALAVAHELHRDVDQQRGNTLMEVTQELARLRGATAAHAEKIQQLAAALRYAQNLHNLLPRREPGEASAASGGPCLDDADDDPDMAPSARLYLFWEYTSASVCGASCGSCGHLVVYVADILEKSANFASLLIHAEGCSGSRPSTREFAALDLLLRRWQPFSKLRNRLPDHVQDSQGAQPGVRDSVPCREARPRGHVTA